MSMSSFNLGLAAGFVKGLDRAFYSVLRSPARHITAGSFCAAQRDGNDGERYWYDSETGTSYNSMGLPCPAPEVVCGFLADMRTQAHAAEEPKSLFASIAPFSPKDTSELFQRFGPLVDGIELNASCPNVWGSSGQKPIPSLEPALFAEHLDALKSARRIVHGDPRIRVKVSSMGDALAHDIGKLIADAGFIEAVVASNTVPNQHPVKPDGSDALSFTEAGGTEKRHVGGMGGRKAKPYALSTVTALRKALPGRLSVIGCGGILEGADLHDYVKAGANAAQIGTGFYEEGGKIFSSVLAGAIDLEND